MQDANIIQTHEQMESLMKQYPILGMLIMASDGNSFVTSSFDKDGNELRITTTVGDYIRYEEIKRHSHRPSVP